MAFTKAEDFIEAYKASWEHKESLGLHTQWPRDDKYYRGMMNPSEDADDPGSNTNIIHPAIEGQIADLVANGLDFVMSGEEPSDQLFSGTISDIVHWVLDKNNMPIKLDRFERSRLKFGTAAWKVFYNPYALGGLGNIEVLPLNPAYTFWDPRVSSIDGVQDGEFVFVATNRSHEYVKRRFGVDLQETMGDDSYNPRFFQDENMGALNNWMKRSCLILECWVRDEDGGLRIAHVMAGKKPMILRDTQEIYRKKATTSEGKKKRRKIYKYGQFPLIPVPCYFREGVLWGDGDPHFLEPSQDLINDLDDQILRNARLMGNLQIVVNRASGINLKLWTPTPGLMIPAANHDAWRQVLPPNMPSYILNRRNDAFREVEMISSRPDVLQGRQSGSVRAASAIIAMQERGLVKSNHKRLMMEASFNLVVERIIEQVKEFFDEERAFRIRGVIDDGTLHRWFKGTDLRKIPRHTPSVNGDGSLVPLMENGKPVTKDAMFDIHVSVGSGLPSNKAFLYQSLIELTGSIITPVEARDILRNHIKWPLPLKSAEQLQAEMQNAQKPQMPLPPQEQAPQQGMPQGPPQGAAPDYNLLFSSLGPDFMGKLMAMLGGQSGGTPGGMNSGLSGVTA